MVRGVARPGGAGLIVALPYGVKPLAQMQESRVLGTGAGVQCARY